MKKAEPDLAGTAGPGDESSGAGADAGNAGAGPSNAGEGSSTRRRILRIALTLMSQRGVDGTSMRDLAAAAELNVASLYHYFPSKRDLLESVLVEQGFLPLEVTVGPPRSGRPDPGSPSGGGSEPKVADAAAESDLAGLIQAILSSMFEVEDFVRLMVGEAMRGEATARSVGLDLFSNFELSTEAWVRTHRPDLDERAGAADVARLISAMVVGLFIQHAAGALPNEGDDLAALVAKRSAEAARVIAQ